MKGNQMEGNNGPGTIVGVNVALSGTLKDQNDIAVYGMVDGEVISDRSITIGQSAQVKGPVRGQVITVAGTVHGEIDAGEKLEILETGKVYGSITAKDLIIRSGAFLDGKVAMGGADEVEAEVVSPEAIEGDQEFKEEKLDDQDTDQVNQDEAELTPDEE